MAFAFRRVDVDDMLEEMTHDQFAEWVAFFDHIVGWQDAWRMDLATDRIVTILANIYRKKDAPIIPMTYWNSAQEKPKPEKSADDVHDQIRMLVEIEELRKLNIQRGAELRAKRGQ